MLVPRAPSGTLLRCGGTQPLILRRVPDPMSKNEKFLTCRPINTAPKYKAIVNRMTAMFNFLGIIDFFGIPHVEKIQYYP